MFVKWTYINVEKVKNLSKKKTTTRSIKRKNISRNLKNRILIKNYRWRLEDSLYRSHRYQHRGKIRIIQDKKERAERITIRRGL